MEDWEDVSHPPLDPEQLSHLESMDPANRFQLGHAMQRMAGILLNTTISITTAPVAAEPYTPFDERQVGYHAPYHEGSEDLHESGTGLVPYCTPEEGSFQGDDDESKCDEAEEEAQLAATAANAAAAMSQGLVAQAMGKLRSMQRAATEAADAADAQSERLRCARARRALQSRQLEELAAEAEALQAEEATLQATLARRRAAQRADEAILADHLAQVASERSRAQRVLRDAIERVGTARARLVQLEGETGAHRGEANANAVRELTEAQAALAQRQAEEGAREAMRRSCIETEQKAYERNADLAAIDAEAAQASVDAIHMRLEGKKRQAELLRRQLEDGAAIEAVEAPAAELAKQQAARLQREFNEAAAVLRAERERAQRAMSMAAAAANASLRAMARGDRGALPLDAIESDLQSQLQAAAHEVKQWRCAVEAMQQMQDVVVVHIERSGEAPPASSAGGTVVLPYRPGDEGTNFTLSLASRIRNASLRLEQLATKRLQEFAPEWLATSSGSGAAAGAALVGAGVGLVAFGPVAGTALATGAGAAAYAARRHAEHLSSSAKDRFPLSRPISEGSKAAEAIPERQLEQSRGPRDLRHSSDCRSSILDSSMLARQHDMSASEVAEATPLLYAYSNSSIYEPYTPLPGELSHSIGDTTLAAGPTAESIEHADAAFSFRSEGIGTTHRHTWFYADDLPTSLGDEHLRASMPIPPLVGADACEGDKSLPQESETCVLPAELDHRCDEEAAAADSIAEEVRTADSNENPHKGGGACTDQHCVVDGRPGALLSTEFGTRSDDKLQLRLLTCVVDSCEVRVEIDWLC